MAAKNPAVLSAFGFAQGDGSSHFEIWLTDGATFKRDSRFVLNVAPFGFAHGDGSAHLACSSKSDQQMAPHSKQTYCPTNWQKSNLN